MSGLETVALIASIAGAATTAVGTIAAGNAKAAQAESEAKAQEFQAKQLELFDTQTPKIFGAVYLLEQILCFSLHPAHS